MPSIAQASKRSQLQSQRKQPLEPRPASCWYQRSTSTPIFRRLVFHVSTSKAHKQKKTTKYQDRLNKPDLKSQASHTAINKNRPCRRRISTPGGCCASSRSAPRLSRATRILRAARRGKQASIPTLSTTRFTFHPSSISINSSQPCLPRIAVRRPFRDNRNTYAALFNIAAQSPTLVALQSSKLGVLGLELWSMACD